MGVHTVMLTGDNRGSAGRWRAALGIERSWPRCCPATRPAKCAALMGQGGGKVAMVGDGINDAPALAAADVGIAMAGGTDVAMHTAGITLMRGDPRWWLDAIDISQRTWRKIRQNLGWAFAYNIIGIPLAAFGLLNPVLAGAAMALSSVSVVANALLLRRWQPQLKRVTEAVQGVDKDAVVQIDLDSKKVRVDSAAELERIAGAIDGAGYPVTEKRAA
jgi:Cu+-exporting ATPase